MAHLLLLLLALFVGKSVSVNGWSGGALLSPPINGVNMGGWFVLEQFLNRDLLFGYNDSRVVDEYTYCKYGKNDPAKMKALHDHWNNWVQESDIAKMAQIGFDHVRIPIPHWSVETADEMAANDEYYETGQWEVLTPVLRLLKKYKIKALIEIHTAVGSQNGYDNSGMIRTKMQDGEYVNDPGFLNTPPGNDQSRSKQLTLMARICQKIIAYENDPTINGTIVAFGVLNEPASWQIYGGIGAIKNFYLDSYNVVRQILPASRYWFVIDHAFQNGQWVDFMTNFEKVLLDVHIYHCFDEGLRAASYAVHAQVACGAFAAQVTNQTLPVIVGEWSIAYKLDSIFAASEPFPTFEQMNWVYQFALLQMSTYGSNFYWNFKTPSAPFWDYFLGYDNGYLPQLPVDQSSIANMCSRTQWGPYSTTKLEVPINHRNGTYTPPSASSSTSSTSSSSSSSSTSSTSSSSSSTSSSSSSTSSTSSTSSSTSSTSSSSSTPETSSTSSTSSSTSSLPTSSTSSQSTAVSRTEDLTECSSEDGSTDDVQQEASAQVLIPMMAMAIIVLIV